jgi:hypothetical protein
MHHSIKVLGLGAALLSGHASASAAVVSFVGTRQNVNFVLPPATGRCAPLNTVVITPTGPSSSGTSNFGDFVLTNSHCIPGPPNAENPVRAITDGEFLWEFAAGDTLFGSYAGQATWDAGVVTGAEDMTVLGGTGRFLGATGLLFSRGTLRFGMVDERPVGIFNGTVEGRLVAPAIPEPATWAMMVAGFGLVGGALRRRGGFSGRPGHRPRAAGADPVRAPVFPLVDEAQPVAGTV